MCFVERKLTYPECMRALEATLTDLIPRLSPAHLPALRILLAANNEIVMRELQRRISAVAKRTS
jgi:hypothetical protein